MRKSLLVLVLLGSTIAAAEPVPAAATDVPKSLSTALWLSLGTSAAGLGLVLVGADIGIRPQAYQGVRGVEPVLVGIGAAGLLVGPSLGSAYAGHFWNTGTALRLAGLGLAAGGVGLGYTLEDHSPTRDSGPDPLPYLVFAAAGAVYLAGATYEIATPPRAVEHYNHVHHLEATFAPAPIRTPDGHVTPGLGLAGTF